MSKEYEHIQFSFSAPPAPSDACNGKKYEITAYLLIPVEVVPEFQAWSKDVADEQRYADLSGDEMYKNLLAKGALLHREDGPAYKTVRKSIFYKDIVVVINESYWEKGVQKPSGTPRIKPLGKYTI